MMEKERCLRCLVYDKQTERLIGKQKDAHISARNDQAFVPLQKMVSLLISGSGDFSIALFTDCIWKVLVWQDNLQFFFSRWFMKSLLNSFKTLNAREFESSPENQKQFDLTFNPKYKVKWLLLHYFLPSIAASLLIVSPIPSLALSSSGVAKKVIIGCKFMVM